MNKTLESFLKRRWVKNLKQLAQADELEKKFVMLSGAGFDAAASKLMDDLEKNKIAKLSEKRLVVKKPAFRRMTYRTSWFANAWIFSILCGLIGLVLSLLFSTAPLAIPLLIISTFMLITVTSAFWSLSVTLPRYVFSAVRLSHDTYLFKTSPSKFTGNVPVQVAEAMRELKNDGFTPEVWFVGTMKEAAQLVDGALQQLDPLLVGTNERLDYAVVYAVWGEDIESLSSFLED